MTLCDKRRSGFTLIELLVVVLIIGILAAIVWPQYQVAVYKAKIMNLIPIARSIYASMERCEMANGSPNLCVNPENLDIQIPGAKWSSPAEGFANIGYRGAWCSLRRYPAINVECLSINGPHDVPAWIRVFQRETFCIAGNEGAFDESKDVGYKLCKSLGGVLTSKGWNSSAKTSSYGIYKLP